MTKRVVDDDPLDRDAALAGVGEGVYLGFVGGRLPVAVGVDDQRRVRSQLQVDLLVGDAAADVPADPGRAGEGDRSSQIVLDDRVAELPGERVAVTESPASGIRLTSHRDDDPPRRTEKPATSKTFSASGAVAPPAGLAAWYGAVGSAGLRHRRKLPRPIASVHR